MADYIYLVQMDVPAEKEADFNRVYDTQHVPELSKVPGVRRVTRYCLESANVDGVAKYAAIYELDGDTLRICVNEDLKTIERPGRFPATGGRSVMVLKRQKTP